MDINYFKAIQNSIGVNTVVEATIRESKEQLKDEMLNSVGLVANGKRNGKSQKFVLASEISLFKYKIVAFPDDELNIGDVLDMRNEKWIVKDVKLSNPIQRVGTAYLCNLNLKFQTRSSDIIERPAVLDKGQYSTTVGEEKDIRYPDSKIKIYLPYDDETKYLYVDKRIATGIIYDKYGSPMLEVYKITKVNYTTVNFGKGAHLLELTVESDQYSPSNDNLDDMICDYISPVDTPISSTEKLKCKIKGRPTILLENSRLYTPVFYDKDGNEVEGVIPSWNLTAVDGITLENIDNKAKITVGDSDDLIGTVFTLTLQDTNNLYEPCNMEIEVTI